MQPPLLTACGDVVTCSEQISHCTHTRARSHPTRKLLTTRHYSPHGDHMTVTGSRWTSPDGRIVLAIPLPLDAYSAPRTLIGSHTCGCSVSGTSVRTAVTAGRDGAFGVAQLRHNDSSNCRRRLFSAVECVSGRNRFVRATRTGLVFKLLREATRARMWPNRLAFPLRAEGHSPDEAENVGFGRSTGGIDRRTWQKKAVQAPPSNFYTKNKGVP